MTKNTKGAIVVVTVIGIAFLTWRLMHQGRRAYARKIAKDTGASYITLLTFDEGYLKEWAKALVAKKPIFVYKNENYNTVTGKKI